MLIVFVSFSVSLIFVKSASLDFILMAFRFEEIDDDDYKKMAEQYDKNMILVIPAELPPNFPMKEQQMQACCLNKM